MDKEMPEDEKYEFEKNLSYQRLFLLLNGDIQRKNHIQTICERVSIVPTRFSYLDNLLFYIQSVNYHASNFESKYDNNKKEITKYINEICEESDKERRYLFTGLVYTPLDSQFEFVSFISSVKKAIESGLKFFVFCAFSETFTRQLTLRRFYEALKDDNKKMNDINGRIKKKYPGFRIKYIREWGLWIEKLNGIRVDYEHFSSAARNLVDVKATTGMSEKGLVVNLLFKKDEPSALLYVKGTLDKFKDFIDFLFYYMSVELEERRGEDFERVIEYFTELNISRYFGTPAIVGHKYELSEMIHDKEKIRKMREGKIPFTQIKMIDKEQ